MMDIWRPGHSRTKNVEAGIRRDGAEGHSDSGRTSIAVVGLACRYPDADDVAGLFGVIIGRRRAFRRIPPGRLDLTDYYSADRKTPDATYSTRAALIEGWRFDRAAFGISEARFLGAEPARWLGLETAARALAAAGFAGGNGLPADRTGVYVGGPPGGAGPGPIAAAICDQFGFGGAGFGVDAGAASSVVAVATACSALTAGEVDAAVAGGVDVSLDPLTLVGLAQAGLLATADVRIYDQNPTGFLPGEGCGMVLLMRTADARAADLPVYAEILGCGVASAGQRHRAPADHNGLLLALGRAYESARIDPPDVALIEGCGTGAGPADEAELTALTMLRSGAKQPADIGAVTANIGHTGAAAGAAGLIKAVLATANGVLPPATGLGSPHPLLLETGAGLRMAAAPRPWPDDRPRYAGVSATSLDGLAAHIVLGRTEHARPGQGGQSQPPSRLAAGLGPPSAFLVHAPDRRALIAILSRLADVAPWLSDAQLHDLACQFATEAVDPGRVKVAIVATRQEQLARLVREAITMVPELSPGQVATRPGIFAADSADGLVTLLLADESRDPAASPAQQLDRALSVLRRLDELGVQPTAAVGHGLGELAGLVWAGCLSAASARMLAERRAAALAAPATAAPGSLSDAIDEFAGFEFGPPRARLYSGGTGAELTSASQIPDCLSAELLAGGLARGDDAPGDGGRLAAAVGAGAARACLLLLSGRDRELTRAIGQLGGGQSGPGQRRLIPVVSIDGDPADDRCLARAAAALFAASALAKADRLYSGHQARPIDIWREPVFISHPGLAPATRTSGPRQPDRPRPAPAPRRSPTALARPPQPRPAADPVTPAADRVAEATPGVTGVAPWLRCYAEQRLEPANPTTAPDDGPWRIYTGGGESLRNEVVKFFRAEPAAGRTLAVLGQPFDPAAVDAAVLAARDAISTGKLLAISPYPGWAGLWASLRAEHPATAITTVRAELDQAGLRAASLIGVAAGEHRELAIDADGSVRELVMAPAKTRRADGFPFGPDDVVLISRGAGPAGLALAQVLACCGAAVVIVGRVHPASDDAVIAVLEELRQAGAAIGYEIVNPASATALAAAVRRIEDRLGPVTAVAHGAGAERGPAIARLTAAGLRARVAEQTATLDRLVTAARGRDRALRFVITFGSAADRYGLGQDATAALATGALADHAERLAAAGPGGRSLHVDWAPSVAAEPGARLLLSALGSLAELPARIALHGRLAERAPGPVAFGGGAEPAFGWRFTERVVVHYPRVELIAEAVIDQETDPYLSEYVVDGACLLPPAIAIEAMAQAASALAGVALRAASEVSMAAPVVLSGQHPAAVIRLCALVTGPVDDAVTVILRCDSTGFAVDHFRATFRLAAAAAEPGPVSSGASGGQVVKAGELYGPVLFQTGRFRRLTTVRVAGSRAATGVIDGVGGQPWFAAERSSGLVLGSAAVTDAALQLAQVCGPDRRMMFGGCRSVAFSGRDLTGAGSVRAVGSAGGPGPAGLVPRPRLAESGGGQAGVGPAGFLAAETSWDVDVVDADCRPIACFRGLVLRDAGPLPRTSPWPLALAGCFIERAAAELGLGPGLEVRFDRRSVASRQRTADGWVRTPAADVGPAGLIMRVRAPGPAACGWRAVKPAGRRAGGWRPGGPAERWLAVLDDRLAGLGPRGLAGLGPANWARATALASCAGPEADPETMSVEPRPVAGTDWLLVRAGSASLACAVIEVAGAGHPVAIAIRTGALDRAPTARGSSAQLALR